MAIGTAAAILGAGALGAAGSAFAANKASKAQQRAAQQGINAQKRMFERQVELQEPFRQAGIGAQNQLLTLLGLPGGTAGGTDYGSMARPFGMSDFQADPGYGFRMSEGMKALESSAAARGGLLSGSTLKGVTRFGQDAASQEYQNAFNRYQVNRSNQLNPLQSLMGSGQSATNILTGEAGNLGRSLGENALGAGNARASGYIGSANAYTNAINQMGNLGAQYYGLRPPTPGSSTGMDPRMGVR